MNKIQLIAFRVIVQFLILICGQLLGFSDVEFGKKEFWKIEDSLEIFYSKVDPS